MKRFQSITFLALMMSLVVLSSCKKDDDPVNNNNGGNNAKTCYVTKFEATIIGVKATSTFTYNSSNRLTETTTDFLGDKSGTTMTYNAEGRVIKIEEWDMTSSDVFEYMEITWNGDLISEVKHYQDDGMGGFELSYTEKAIYDNGKPTKVEMFYDNNGSPSKEGETTYTFDANGNLTQKTTFSMDNGSLVPSYRETYTYDDKKTSSAYSWTILEDVFVNANHNITSEKSESYDNGTWTTDDDMTYTYTYTAENYPATVSIQGLGSGTFTYDCK